MFMTLPKLIKIEDIKEFADKVSGEYFYILKKYNEREYLIQVDEDTSTQYDFIISDDDKEKVLFKIVGNINSNKKYKASLITDPYLGDDEFLVIYEPEYFVKEFKDNEIKNSIELQEENKKIEELFNQLKSVLAGISEGTAIKQKQDIVEFVKEEDKETDLEQFYNIVEEVYNEADIEKRYKRIKLIEKEKEVEEKEKEYGLKDEDVENENEGDDDE